MRCNKVIMPDPNEPRRTTYCVRKLGHTGPCDIREYTSICYVCSPPTAYPSIKTLEDHVKEVHRIWKGQ